MNTLSIKSLAIQDRPREKLMAQGKVALSNAELLAILIGSGNTAESAVALCQRILASVKNNLNELTTLSVAQLMQFKGIGEAKAISIITALELGKRRHFEHSLQKPIIKTSNQAFLLMQPIIGELPHEEFWVAYLNNANKVLYKMQLSKGGLTATTVDIRLLFKKAIELSAVAILVAHNHPSGKTVPSKADKILTQKIKTAGTTLDIKLLDHLIITQNEYFSFADNLLL